MEFPSVSFSTDEANAAQADADKTDAAVRFFRECGAVRLLNVFTEGFRERLRQHYMAQYRLEMEATRQADKRPLFTVHVEGPVAEESYLANPLVAPIVERLLGKDFVLGAVSTVISFPGSPQQFVHRDSPSLCGDYSVDATLPPYALTTLIPMVDANTETGSTRVWLGSHRLANADQRETLPSDSPDVPFGSMLMTDSRVLHCGSPNQSQRVRPLLYNTYHRNWFRDFSGYERRQAVSVSRKVRAQMPPHVAQRFRIADEANGQPEGPLPLPGLLANALPPGLQKLVVGRRNV
ncbi:MAG: phytanoyl-CoA dioxygenase family protein [Deltaproteobacteria bacterium]|nr:phytanoyl-CoA dioxygenase family protein [Deltaproteobacteria bacterium]